MMLSSPELEGLVRKAIMLYNRFRSPEVFVKLVRLSLESVTIGFSGSFCYSCGVLDYVEDFIHEFKMLTDKFELRIDRTRQMSPRSFEADYKVVSRQGY